jgi:hypothetical protein
MKSSWILFLFLLTGCGTMKIADYPVFSMDKEAGLRLKTEHPEAKEVSYEHCNHKVFFIHTNAHMTEQQIIAEALKQSPGANVLTDSGSQVRMFIIPFFIYDHMCLKIYGSAIKV